MAKAGMAIEYNTLNKTWIVFDFFIINLNFLHNSPYKVLKIFFGVVYRQILTCHVIRLNQ